MTEMIERVARAAYESLFDGEWPDVGTSIDADGFRTAARAAIEAMREPTQEMGLAFARYWHDNYREDHVLEDTPAKECWRAMIDAALGKVDA